MADPLVRGVWRRWPRRAERAELQFPLGGLDGVRVGRRHDGAEPQAEREQVVDGDRPLGRHGVVEGSVETSEHVSIGELGEELVDRTAQLEHPVLDEDHGRGGRDRLAQRGDPEDRVPLERFVVVDCLGADDVDVHVVLGTVVPGDERDEPRHLARLDVAGHELVQSVEPRWRHDNPSRSMPRAVRCREPFDA